MQAYSEYSAFSLSLISAKLRQSPSLARSPAGGNGVSTAHIGLNRSGDQVTGHLIAGHLNQVIGLLRWRETTTSWPTSPAAPSPPPPAACAAWTRRCSRTMSGSFRSIKLQGDASGCLLAGFFIELVFGTVVVGIFSIWYVQSQDRPVQRTLFSIENG